MKRFLRAGSLFLCVFFFIGSVASALEETPQGKASWGTAVVSDENFGTVRVPILMYHDLSRTEDSDYVVSVGRFKEQLAALQKAEYHTVTLAQLRDFVYRGYELPENPIVITFDDGYTSNYELGLPVLKELGMKATIFFVGSSVGCNTYKDTGKLILPHFTFEQANEMLASSLIELQSHTYDMHQAKDFEKGIARSTLAQLPGETDSQYAAVVKKDVDSFRELLAAHLGQPLFALAYPQGVFSDLSEQVLSEKDITVTLTTQGGVNIVKRADAQSLRKLKRCHVSGKMTPEQLLKWIGNPSVQN